MATMKDVAREAGVALGTVSNVFNNRATVSNENREKVMRAVEKLQYVPNQAARTLKTNSTKSIGLIIPSITNPFYPELARGVEDKIHRFGYTVLLCNADRDMDKELGYIKLLVGKNVDGIIIVKSKSPLDVIESMCRRCPFVLVDTQVESSKKFGVINVNEEKGIFDALQLFYEYGHRRIAFISGLMESASSRSRLYAYKQFLRKNQLPLDDELIKEGSYDWYSGYTRAKELLRIVTPPTAILASNDLMAIGAMKAVEERRLRIPDDISIIGIDDIDMASLCTPSLTTLRQPKYEMGALSAQKLVEQLEKKNTGASVFESTILNQELILRNSVGRASSIN